MPYNRSCNTDIKAPRFSKPETKNVSEARAFEAMIQHFSLHGLDLRPISLGDVVVVHPIACHDVQTISECNPPSFGSPSIPVSWSDMLQQVQDCLFFNAQPGCG
jgi:hypothetical protein